MGISIASLADGQKMGPVTKVLGILVVVGLTNCDQSAYPATNVVAPLNQEYADTGIVDNSAYYNQADYGQSAYDYSQYSDTDRTAELIESAITVPMAITAFFAALLGGFMAPIISDGMRALGEFELPEFEFPELKKKTKGKQPKQNVGKFRDNIDNFAGRAFDEPLAKPVSSLFKLAAEKIITNAIDRLQKAQ